VAGNSPSVLRVSRLNAALSSSDDPLIEDLRHHLRNDDVGTVPLYDPNYLNSFASELFMGSPVMSAHFLPVIQRNPERVLRFGQCAVSRPFHSLDCGLCQYLACFVDFRLGYRYYVSCEFARMHRVLSGHLTHLSNDDCKSLPDTLSCRHYDSGSDRVVWKVRAPKGFGYIDDDARYGSSFISHRSPFDRNWFRPTPFEEPKGVTTYQPNEIFDVSFKQRDSITSIPVAEESVDLSAVTGVLHLSD